MNSIIPNFVEAERFLNFLAPDETEFTFQTIVDNKSCSKIARNRAALNRVFHGSFSDNRIQLGALNMNGAGVFVMINRGNGIVLPGRSTCRSNANVTAVRSLFVDLDGAPLEPVATHKTPPNMIVESSPGKWHAYWRVCGCPMDMFSHLQTSLAKHFSGDPAVKDLARVMRLPGFHHQKREPFMTHIIHPEGRDHG